MSDHLVIAADLTEFAEIGGLHRPDEELARYVAHGLNEALHDFAYFHSLDASVKREDAGATHAKSVVVTAASLLALLGDTDGSAERWSLMAAKRTSGQLPDYGLLIEQLRRLHSLAKERANVCNPMAEAIRSAEGRHPFKRGSPPKNNERNLLGDIKAGFELLHPDTPFRFQRNGETLAEATYLARGGRPDQVPYFGPVRDWTLALLTRAADRDEHLGSPAMRDWLKKKHSIPNLIERGLPASKRFLGASF